VNARGRIVWKNESNTVAGLQFIDADKEIAGEVRSWLNFGESLQELRGDWWPDSHPENPFASPTTGKADTVPLTLPPRSSAPIEMPAPSAAATLPDYTSLAASDDEPATVELPQPTLFESRSQPGPDTHAPESSAPVVIGFPSQEARRQRHSYDYVRPSVQEEHREKFVIAGIAGAACVLVLIGWFVFGHKSNSATAVTAVPAQSSSTQQSAPSSAPPAAPLSRTLPASSIPDLRVSASQPVAHASTPNAVAPSNPATNATSSVTSELVLQVAAMTEEINANKLATSLKSEHFPAFVSKRNGDRFYRVLVGPFPGETPLREAADNLKKTGYDSIEKHWAP
jgi:cell division septation protein DedD